MTSKPTVLPFERYAEQFRHEFRQWRSPRTRSIAKGLLAGAVAGVLGAWLMSEFADASSRWFDLNRKTRRRGHKPLGSEEEMDATIGVARLLEQRLAPDVKLSCNDEYRAAIAVHYAIGAALGAIYGALAEVAPLVRKGTGAAFTATEWGVGEFIIPALPFMRRSYPAAVRLQALAGHIVLGVTMELARSGLRKVI